ncbi:MAG: hypothetical protein J0M13_10880 [Candidatus Accumulibacter sp.]|jgi:hypothetical protein|nr:hypothetical protein [Candidatus Accumulibacter necessarius]
MDKKKPTKEFSADEIRDLYVAASARLFSCDQDEDPRIEALKTDETRHISAAAYLLTLLEKIQAAREINQSPVVLNFVRQWTKTIAEYGCFQLHHLRANSIEDQQRIVEQAISDRARIGGASSKRPPSLTSGRALVDQWKRRNSRRRWTWLVAWGKLVEIAHSESAIGEFTVSPHDEDPDQILFTISGKTSPLKKTSFRTYWNAK